MARNPKRLSYLADRAASSWVVVLLSYPLFILDSFGLFGTSQPESGRGVLETLISSFFTLLVILAVITLFHISLLRLKFARRHPSLTLLIFVLAITADQIFQSVIRNASPSQNLSLSMEAIIYQTAVLAVIASVVVSLKQLRRRQGELAKLNLELDQSQKQSLELLDQIRQQAKEQVLTSVQNAMVSGAEKLDELTKSLRSKAAEEVRKLSHQLAFNPKNLELVKVETKLPSWSEIWSILGVKPRLAPNLMAWVMVLLAFRLSIAPPTEEQISADGLRVTIDLAGFLISASQIVLAWVSTYFAAKLGERLILRLRRGARDISFSKHTLVVLGVGALASVLNVAVSAVINLESDFDSLLLQFIFYLLPITFIAFVVGLISAAKKRLRLAVSELDSKSQELRRNVAQINLAVFNEQQALSRFLHGQVQSTIFVLADRLELQNPSDLQLARYHVQERVKDILHDLEKQFQPMPIQNGINKVVELWSGVMSIEVELFDYVAEIINQDANCGSGLVEVISEACSNAHKHGRANSLKIMIRNPYPDTIRLTITNNGSLVLMNRSQVAKGYGSSIFDQFTQSWSWSETHPATFTADFPLRFSA